MKKLWIPIISVLAAAVIGASVWIIFFQNVDEQTPQEPQDSQVTLDSQPSQDLEESQKPQVPPFSNEVKEAVMQERPSPTIIWYDENGNVEEPGVWRYIGTYGDCYAFLEILQPTNALFEPIELPYDIQGLSRPVSYPQVASVVLYHTMREFTWEELQGRPDETGTFADYRSRMEYLEFARKRQDWITDAQWEQLTKDIEALSEAAFALQVPPFSDEVKKAIKELGWSPDGWYDENGGVEEPGVWRYIGTYGDCYAFLEILQPTNALFEPIELPYDIQALSRPVAYPQVASVILYHATQEFTRGEVNVSTRHPDEVVRMEYIEFIGNRSDWLTDAQLEQLTTDIEKLASEHS